MNHLLMRRLSELGLWTRSLREKIMAHGGTCSSGVVIAISPLPRFHHCLHFFHLNSSGSIQSLIEIPEGVRALFKTVWDIDPQVLVDMAADRGRFTCQSQSLSLYFPNPTLTLVVSTLSRHSSIHDLIAGLCPIQSKTIYKGWEAGLKTGMYYLRTKPATRPIPITLPVTLWGETVTGSLDDSICIDCSA